MENTHEFPDNNFAQDPGEDCELPEPVRTSYFQTATCVHGTKFLLVTQYDETCAWKDAEKYWARSREHYQREAETYERTVRAEYPTHPKNFVIENNYFIDVDWNERP